MSKNGYLIKDGLCKLAVKQGTPEQPKDKDEIDIQHKVIEFCLNCTRPECINCREVVLYERNLRKMKRLKNG